MTWIDDLSKKEFKRFKTIFLILSIVTGFYFIFFAKTIISLLLVGIAFGLSLYYWARFKRKELYG